LLVLFSGLMGDIARSIKSFKNGLTEESEDNVKPEPEALRW